jgi:hypothetical protein
MTNKPLADRPPRLIKPTLDTKFHIDYSWWDRQERELRVYMMSFLPEEHRQLLEEAEELEEVDYVDPDTAEVTRIDPLQQAVKEATREADFAHTSLVDAVFRVFVLNNNTPLSPNELSDLIGRPPMTILRTLSGTRVYRGIRPYVKPE